VARTELWISNVIEDVPFLLRSYELECIFARETVVDHQSQVYHGRRLSNRFLSPRKALEKLVVRNVVAPCALRWRHLPREVKQVAAAYRSRPGRSLAGVSAN
jgi:hypothetical protein